MSRRCRRRHRRPLSISDRRLYRDPARGRIAGVCAGLADHFKVDTWLVRIIAITGLLFMPQIVFWAYIIAWIVLPRRAELEAENRVETKAKTKDDGLREEYARQARFDEALRESDEDNVLDLRRRSFRQCREALDRVDQRIRKLESYVTSRRFDLDREFRKI